MFLNGFLIASLFYFKMQAAYEDGLFTSIKTSVDSRIDADDTRDSVVVKTMQVCNYLMSNRLTTFANGASLGATADFFHPTSVDLMTTRGACGSYSQVLARMLASYHYPIRIAQMRAGGIWAAHNLVEVNTGNRWVVLDPTYNVCFVTPDHRLASFADVHANWPWYSRQIPRGYDPQYRYEDVRYSNWNKIPLVLPAVKRILNLTMGREKADKISMRTWFLQIYTLYCYLTLLVVISISLFTLRKLIQIKVFPDPNIPFTRHNLIKYIGLQIVGKRTGIMH